MMKPSKYIWQNGEYKPWHEATVHVLSNTLHYGSGAFEGIRAYSSKQGPIIYQLEAHVDRLLYSAKSIGMTIVYSKKMLCDVIRELVDKNNMSEGYIRPLFYYGYGRLNVNLTDNVTELAIACWPLEDYLPNDCVDVKTSQYVRIHPQTTIIDAKLCGHYLNSQLASLEIRGTQYQEVLLLDINGFVAEGASENIFVVKDKCLMTPKPDNILCGITRATVMDLAQQVDLQVIEKDLFLEEIYQADEAFFTGTAADIVAIRSLDDKVIGSGTIGPITGWVKKAYSRCVRGEVTESLFTT